MVDDNPQEVKEKLLDLQHMYQANECMFVILSQTYNDWITSYELPRCKEKLKV